MDLSEFENDPRLFLFTSLTAGSSHIITATSRLETILKANKIPFQAIDTATDEKARRLWQRRAQQKKLPGLVKDGFVIGDLEEVEEWNEFGELKENIGPVPSSTSVPVGGGRQGINTRPTGENLASASPPHVDGTTPTTSTSPPSAIHDLARVALPGASEISDRNKENQPLKPPSGTTAAVIDEPAAAAAVETTNSAPADKEKSTINAAREIAKNHPALEHMSAPASRIHSGTATPTTTNAGVLGEGADGQGKRLEVDEGEETNTTQKRISSLRFAEPDKEKSQSGQDRVTQDQAAKEAGEAGKSVED